MAFELLESATACDRTGAWDLGVFAGEGRKIAILTLTPTDGRAPVVATCLPFGNAWYVTGAIETLPHPGLWPTIIRMVVFPEYRTHSLLPAPPNLEAAILGVVK